MASQNIVLVGFMGTGKTTLGELLASKLARPLVDMDESIEKQAGKTIPRIFDEDGESHFRKLEKKLAKELAGKSGLIISTGGGIVLDPENIAQLSSSGMVVCLSATPEEILERLAKDEHRPLLNGDKEAKIRDILAEREDLYAAIPYQLETSGRDPKELSARIVKDYLSLKDD